MSTNNQVTVDSVQMDGKTPQVESLHLEHSLNAGLSYEDATFLHHFPTRDHDKAFRKVDWRLMPMLMSLYLIANLDRFVAHGTVNVAVIANYFSANLGNAKIEGLEKDLGMKGTDYNLANMLFFVPYILLEIPANTMLMRFRRPSQWIGFIVTSWGIVMTCTGFVNNFTGLMICRLLLGVFE